MKVFKYKFTKPTLPPGATSPIMDSRQMEEWANQLGAEGWEFVGYGARHWVGSEPFIQDWWIFRQEITKA